MSDVIEVRVSCKKEFVRVEVTEATFNIKSKHVVCPAIFANVAVDIDHDLNRSYALWRFTYGGQQITFASETIKDNNSLTIISTESFSAGEVTCDIIAFS